MFTGDQAVVNSIMIRRRPASPPPSAPTARLLLGLLFVITPPRLARAFGPLPPSFWHPSPSSSLDPAATEVKHVSAPSQPPPSPVLKPHPVAARPSAVKDVLALDFDGVLCHSVDESSRTAFRSVKKLWPQLATYCSASGGNECPGWLSDRWAEE